MNTKVRVLFVLLCLTGISVFWRVYLSPYSPPQDGRPCACHRCIPEDDQWFRKHFNKSVEPFLSANYSLSEDAFNWWKHLQTERCNFSIYKQTVDRLFKMFPPPDFIKASPDRCMTCAVVGNSVNLKGSHYGPLIDFHDIIIRMNSAPVKGYETDVGTRTTHHIMYPESAVDLDSYTHLVLVPFKILDLKWVTKALDVGFFGFKSYAPAKPKIKAKKDLVMVINPAFMRYAHDTWLEKKGRYPSTGFMALILALHICEQISVFGFGADGDRNWSHYWEGLKDKKFKTGIHSGNYEYEVILKLAEQQVITFYKGR